MPYPQFDRSRLKLEPLSSRRHDMLLGDILPLDTPPQPFENPNLGQISQRIVSAYKSGNAVIWCMGAHVIRRGVSNYLIDLMSRGLISHVALNGAGMIHDFELAAIGATTESVARYISTGQFGLWEETGLLNQFARKAYQEGLGLGEVVGREIENRKFAHKDISILAAGYRLQVPVTVHVSIGQDIIHQHPNCDGAALGGASYADFLVFAHSISGLKGGVFLNFGSAVMGPEVYLKALAMARNVAHQHGQRIDQFTTAVFDLLELPDNYRAVAPKSDPRYYYRPYKTILVRTIEEGGESFYVQGDHQLTIPNLYHQILSLGEAKDVEA